MPEWTGGEGRGGAEPAGQTLCQKEQVDPLVSGFSCLSVREETRRSQSVQAGKAGFDVAANPIQNLEGYRSKDHQCRRLTGPRRLAFLLALTFPVPFLHHNQRP